MQVITNPAANDGDCHEMCDGQQRVVTILIILRAISYWSYQHGAKPHNSIKKLCKYFTVDNSKGEEMPRLKLYKGNVACQYWRCHL